MAFTHIVNLPFDVAAYGKPNTAILNGITDPAPASGFGLVALDVLTLRLFPRQKAAQTGQPTTTVRMGSGFSIIFTAKLQTALGADSTLFNASAFAEYQDGNGNWYYEVSLNLLTDELKAATAGKTSIPVMAVIDVSDAAGGPQRYLLPLTIFNAVYTGDESEPNPGTSGYLSQAQSDARYLRNITGSQTIPSAAASVTVTGQAWGAVPAFILPFVVKNGATADDVFVDIDQSSITDDGFTAYLSGAPSDGTHKLFWLVIGSLTAQSLAASQSPSIISNAVAINLSIAPLIKLNFSSATGTVAITLSNASVGQRYLFQIQQGATARSANFPAGTKQKGGGGTTYTPSGDNALDLIELIYDGSNNLIELKPAYA